RPSQPQPQFRRKPFSPSRPKPAFTFFAQYFSMASNKVAALLGLLLIAALSAQASSEDSSASARKLLQAPLVPTGRFLCNDTTKPLLCPFSGIGAFPAGVVSVPGCCSNATGPVCPAMNSTIAAFLLCGLPTEAPPGTPPTPLTTPLPPAATPAAV
ncbi:hypothetical protein KFL_000090710, partial [Klebsormidium nitens]